MAYSARTGRAARFRAHTVVRREMTLAAEAPPHPAPPRLPLPLPCMQEIRQLQDRLGTVGTPLPRKKKLKGL